MSYFVLADCNNFYVSCERLFNPRLENAPLIVLSNNDGCVIARSQEAKQLGIKMGEPHFKIKELCKQRGVAIHSSNFALYDDISRRVMQLLSQMAPESEIYSIDEIFLKYPATLSEQELCAHCHEMRRRVKRWIGVPISLGLATTKTLAKVANSIAKKDPETGFYHLLSLQKQRELFERLPIADVWGIGRRLAPKLEAISIFTVEDFLNMQTLQIRKKMGVVGERLFLELQGVSCLEIEEGGVKKSITCSRSFGRNITKIEELAEALSSYISSACYKLRGQGSVARAMWVYLETQFNPERSLRSQYGTLVTFPSPTHDTIEMIEAAKRVLPQLFSDEKRYKKCGVTLLELTPEEERMPDLFIPAPPPRRLKLMQVLDEVNTHYGKNTLFLGATGIERSWRMRSELRSPYTTTDWKNLPVAKAQ